MSQFFINAQNEPGIVYSVTGSNGVTALPTTGDVVVSGVNATTSTVGVASFNPAQFTVSAGAVSIIDGSTSYTSVSSTPYNMLSTDVFLGVTTASLAITINLYATPTTGQVVTISDVSANAGANNITVNGNGHNIIGSTSASSYTINANGASINLKYTGSIWKVF